MKTESPGCQAFYEHVIFSPIDGVRDHSLKARGQDLIGALRT